MHLAIAEVDVEIGDLAVDPHKVFLHMLSLVCKSSDPAILEEAGARVASVLLPVQGVPPGTDADVGRHGGPTTSETLRPINSGLENGKDSRDDGTLADGRLSANLSWHRAALLLRHCLTTLAWHSRCFGSLWHF